MAPDTAKKDTGEIRKPTDADDAITQVVRAQATYDEARVRALGAVLRLDVSKAEERQRCYDADARLVRDAGMNKTDAKANRHLDARWQAAEERQNELEAEVKSTDAALSVARNRLNTARLLAALFISPAFAMSLGDEHN